LTSSGKSSCDGSTSEFRIVDLITHHDVSADEQFSGSGYFGLRSTASLCHSFVETLQVLVITDGGVHGFDHQVTQHPRPRFANAQPDDAVCRAPHHRIETTVSDYLALVAKATDWLQRVPEAKCRQQADARMRS
jgi:hypothetical protein